MKTPQKRIYNSASVPQEDCVFCKIVSGALPSYKVYEDEGHIAFLDINPFALGHTLVCPKRHGETLWDMDEREIGEVFKVASKVSKGVVAATEADGFRIMQNNGEIEVDYGKFGVKVDGFLVGFNRLVVSLLVI